ncbi:MAG TPA: glycosyltransferase family 9 protein [Stellaceae bacterium]|nr:glycosyltransferase family 9 protein [Stellaceae bacterium]
MTERILVIKLGALGDFVQAMGPAAAIRVHHPQAHITLLTTPAYAELGRQAPYFDAVWVDERAGWTRPWALFALARRLRRGAFDRVYDLQTSDRSSLYFHLLWPRHPQWSGIAAGASHPHANPDRDRMHTVDRQRDQLAMAGIATVPPPDMSWAASDISRFRLPDRFVLLVPGGSRHRPEKRWPAGRFMRLASFLTNLGLPPVLVGGSDDIAAGAEIARDCPAAYNLIGRTGFGDLVALGGACFYAVGNDTGPMHLIVAGGAPATVLYSAASDPALTAPRGARVTILRRDDLGDLPVEAVAATLPLR